MIQAFLLLMYGFSPYKCEEEKNKFGATFAKSPLRGFPFAHVWLLAI